MLECVELLRDHDGLSCGLLPVRLLERAEDIGTRHDSHGFPVLEDGHAAACGSGDEPHDLGERRVLDAADDIRAHHALHRRMGEPVADRLVEILTRDHADQQVRLANEHPALAVALAQDHRVRDGVVRGDEAGWPRHDLARGEAAAHRVRERLEHRGARVLEGTPVGGRCRL